MNFGVPQLYPIDEYDDSSERNAILDRLRNRKRDINKYNTDLYDIETYRENAADTMPNQYSIKSAEAESRLARAQKLRESLDSLNVPQEEYTDTSSISSPVREYAEIPEYESPQINPISQGLSGLAAALMPQYAGQFLSAPIEGALEQSKFNLQNKLNNYKMEESRNAQLYEDAHNARQEVIANMRQSDIVKNRNVENTYQRGLKLAEIASDIGDVESEKAMYDILNESYRSGSRDLSLAESKMKEIELRVGIENKDDAEDLRLLAELDKRKEKRDSAIALKEYRDSMLKDKQVNRDWQSGRDTLKDAASLVRLGISQSGANARKAMGARSSGASDKSIAAQTKYRNSLLAKYGTILSKIKTDVRKDLMFKRKSDSEVTKAAMGRPEYQSYAKLLGGWAPVSQPLIDAIAEGFISGDNKSKSKTRESVSKRILEGYPGREDLVNGVLATLGL